MKRYILTIPGRLPGLNEYTAENRNNRFAGNKCKRAAERLIRVEIARQLRGVRIAQPVFIAYRWFEPDRRRDKDNVAFAKKFVQDALVSAGVLRGDGWAHVTGFSDEFDVDAERPRVEVVIEVEAVV